ncbi:MAG TPA: hypothetical protein VMR81_04145 [Patescibacteria group bacterium]|nr:hypothetical protein [Patescibacteria group bacterium]
MEWGIAAMVANGGLGYLLGDTLLEYIKWGVPFVGFGLAYDKRKIQKLGIDINGRFHQEDVEEAMPSPTDVGMVRMLFHPVVSGAWGKDNPIEVYQYPIGSDRGQLLLFRVAGEVYPEEPWSNARLWHEAVLGFGAAQVIRELIEKGTMGEPAYHRLNESAAVLEALAVLDYAVLDAGDSKEAFDRELQKLREKTILSNHTLVPAALGRFTWDQCDTFIFSNLKSNEVKSQLASFMRDHGNELILTDLALHLAGRYNAVSEIHAKTAVNSFQAHYNRPFEFTAITNGVYGDRWDKVAMDFLRRRGVIDQFDLPVEKGFDEAIDRLDDDEIINLHGLAVAGLGAYLAAGNRVDQSGHIVTLPRGVLISIDPRRVAGYKRRDMLFRKPDVLWNTLDKHPMQHMFIAGKAHPKDDEGKAMLEFVLNMIPSDKLFMERIHFLPQWDEELALMLLPAGHNLTNTPIVGTEACQTSGMKPKFITHVSTPDGWYWQLKPDSYFRIEGPTDSDEEITSYYTNLDRAFTVAEDPHLWVAAVKKFWKGGALRVASGTRMIGQYAVFGTHAREVKENVIYRSG